MKLLLRHITLLAALTASLASLAQNDATFTQYWAVKNVYNPAAIGNIDFINIRGGGRLQWVGINGAPTSMLISADSPFKIMGKRIGAGLVMNQESIGLYKSLNLSAQGGYKIKFLKGELTAGVSIGFVNETFKGSQTQLPEGLGTAQTPARADEPAHGGGSDESVPTNDVSGSSLDIGAGIFYTHKHFWAGFSATHVNQPSVALSAGEGSELQYEAKIGRTLYFMAGGNIPIKNTLFELQPSILFRTDTHFMQTDVTLRAVYKKFISFGIAYRTSDALSAMAGVEFGNFFAGYSFDYPLTEISSATTGSHEIFAGYKVKLDLSDKNKNKHKSIRLL